MEYEEWLSSVPSEITGDALWNMKVYRLAVFAGDLAWWDISVLMKDQRMIDLSNQLYRAVGSIGANLAEGYSRASARDQARFYEYALGSAREARGWYYHARHILPEPVIRHRLDLLTHVIRQLLAIVPARRGYGVREEEAEYEAMPRDLLDHPPLP